MVKRLAFGAFVCAAGIILLQLWSIVGGSYAPPPILTNDGMPLDLIETLLAVITTCFAAMLGGIIGPGLIGEFWPSRWRVLVFDLRRLALVGGTLCAAGISMMLALSPYSTGFYFDDPYLFAVFFSLFVTRAFFATPRWEALEHTHIRRPDCC